MNPDIDFVIYLLGFFPKINITRVNELINFDTFFFGDRKY